MATSLNLRKLRKISAVGLVIRRDYMNRLKELRNEKDLSLKELSEALSIPYQSLRNYEISKR